MDFQFGHTLEGDSRIAPFASPLLSVAVCWHVEFHHLEHYSKVFHSEFDALLSEMPAFSAKVSETFLASRCALAGWDLGWSRSFLSLCLAEDSPQSSQPQSVAFEAYHPLEMLLALVNCHCCC